MSSPSTLRWDHPRFHGSIHWNCCECKSATWLVVKWRAGASPPVDPAKFFHMTPELKRINFGNLYYISGVQFQTKNMVWISFGLLYCLGAFLAVGSCLGTGRSFWIQYLRVRHVSLKTSFPIFSLEANRGKPVGSAWDFVLQCTYTNASTNLYVFLPNTTYYILPLKEVITNVGM